MTGEKKTIISLLDSSIWLSYLLEGKHESLIDKNEETIYISPLVIFEIKRRLLKKEIPSKEIEEKLNFVKQKTISIEVSDLIAEKASEISHKNKIPAMDSLIYVTSMENNSILITSDNDFRNLPNVKILDK
ncbi:MAG: PIN domain-containing protein [Nanoarchaeota archaeon]